MKILSEGFRTSRNDNKRVISLKTILSMYPHKSLKNEFIKEKTVTLLDFDHHDNVYKTY